MSMHDKKYYMRPRESYCNTKIDDIIIYKVLYCHFLCTVLEIIESLKDIQIIN